MLLRRARGDARLSALGLRLNRFDVQRDRHFIANQQTTGFQRRIPGQSEIFTAYLSFKFKFVISTFEE